MASFGANRLALLPPPIAVPFRHFERLLTLRALILPGKPLIRFIHRCCCCRRHNDHYRRMDLCGAAFCPFFAPIPVLLGGRTRTDVGISSLMEKDRSEQCVVPQVARISLADSRNLVEGGPENAKTPGKVGKLFLAVVGGGVAAPAEGLGLVGRHPGMGEGRSGSKRRRRRTLSFQTVQRRLLSFICGGRPRPATTEAVKTAL